VRELLKAFTDLAGAIITIEALPAQSDAAQVITGRGANCMMTVKGNMPALYRQLKGLPWARIPAVSSVSTGYGRRARRTSKAALAPAWIGSAGAARVAQVRRAGTQKGKKTAEAAYLITSDRDADPAALAAWIRGQGPELGQFSAYLSVGGCGSSATSGRWPDRGSAAVTVRVTLGVAIVRPWTTTGASALRSMRMTRQSCRSPASRRLPLHCAAASAIR
jgi:hypothetical protein